MFQRNRYVTRQEDSAEQQSFLSLLEDSFQSNNVKEKEVTKGSVVKVDENFVTIDVGLKEEGKIDLLEFQEDPHGIPKVGDVIEVYLEKMEDMSGHIVLSREKARREEGWSRLENTYGEGQKIQGKILGRIRGGFTVDVEGVIAFLPGSQLDIRPIKDIQPFLGMPLTFQILKMDKKRNSIVLSRRAVIEEERAGSRSEVLNTLYEGQVIEGTVKNITDYGAFVDLGGLDGLLHVTDISWERVAHPSDVLSLEQKVKVKIIKINPEAQRVSLGIKQLAEDPWTAAAERYHVGDKIVCPVVNIADYGAFVELEKGVEGLVHVSEMGWSKKNMLPSQMVRIGDKVEVVILEISPERHRISFSMKQCTKNPWVQFASEHKVGDIVEGTVENITQFCLFVALNDQIDAILHMNDLDDNLPGEKAIKEYSKGQTIQAKILEIDADKQRIALGIKQLHGDGQGAGSGGQRRESDADAPSKSRYKKGEIVTCIVTQIQTGSIEVKIADHPEDKGFIKRNELSRERNEQHPDRFGVGDKVDAKIIAIGKGELSLSIKALEISEENEAIAQYGSSDSGASLGDILGIAMENARKEKK